MNSHKDPEMNLSDNIFHLLHIQKSGKSVKSYHTMETLSVVLTSNVYWYGSRNAFTINKLLFKLYKTAGILVVGFRQTEI